jgi:hypothetical protein
MFTYTLGTCSPLLLVSFSACYLLLQAGVTVSEQLKLPLALLGSLPIGMCLESLGLPEYNAARHIPHQSFGGESGALL